VCRSDAIVSIRRPFAVTGKGFSTEKTASSFSSLPTFEQSAAAEDAEMKTTMKPWTIIRSVIVPSILVMTRRCMDAFSRINPELVIQEVLDKTSRVVHSVCTTILEHHHESIAMIFAVVAASRVVYYLSTSPPKPESRQSTKNDEDPLF
jgi:hypothetical protein